MSHSNPHRPLITCYPIHPKLAARMNTLIALFQGYSAFSSVAQIEYVGQNAGIRVKSARAGRGSPIVAEILDAWSEFPPLYEADLWDDLIEEKIPDPRLRNWAGSIIWWDNSGKTKGPHREKWRLFENKYCVPFDISPEEFINLAGEDATRGERSRIQASMPVRPKIIDDFRRRSRVMKRVYRWQDQLLTEALTTIGYKKVQN